MNKLKVLHFDNGFWLYYYRLEENKFKWPMTKDEALKVRIRIERQRIKIERYRN